MELHLRLAGNLKHQAFAFLENAENDTF